MNTAIATGFGSGVCPDCGERQWSIFDNRYLEIFGHCWSCDKTVWEEGRLSLEEFEKREEQASKE